MKKIVEQARERVLAEPDTCFYRWFGAMYRESDLFTRLDKTFLYCIYMYNGTPRYNKIIGFPDRTFLEAGTEECIVYTTDIVYRVTTPPRKGRIYPMDRLKDNEQTTVAGVHKKLEFDNEPNKLFMSREHDKFMIRLLKDIIADNVLPTDNILCPEMYLCCAEGNDSLYLRSSQEALKYLSGFSEYDPGETPEHNISNMKDVIAVDAGEVKQGRKRYGYPFRYIYGRGVKAVSPELNGQWYKCPLEDCSSDRGYIQFRFPGKPTGA